MGISTKRDYQKPKFKKPIEPEFKFLRKEVAQLIKRLGPQKQGIIKLKAFLFPALYLASFILLLTAGQHPGIFYVSYMLMGVFLLLNFLNLIHDAVHEVIFKKQIWNRLYVHFFDLLGANSFIWKIRHIRLHHSFPNIMNWDSDFEQSPLVRVFPQSEHHKFHKYQHLYLPFLYPLFLFNWLLVRDFKDFFQKDRIVHRVVQIPRREYLKLFLFKAIFFTYTIYIPRVLLGVSWMQVLSGFILMVFTASIISLVVLLSPHANVHSDFPQENGEGEIPHSWFLHQLKCTNDVSTDNFFIRFFMGSFNYHIAHHLFPNVHHSFYPEITKLIEEFARKNDLPYRKLGLLESLQAHFQLLRTNAYKDNIFEETM